MLNQQTFEKLRLLRLHGMAEAFRAQAEQEGITELRFESCPGTQTETQGTCRPPSNYRGIWKGCWDQGRLPA
jgi:hypothetical protein